jgi:UDPglucose--hexose-1-phosphate uridylyltransferase
MARDATQCPFCPGRESDTTPTLSERCDGTGEWLVRAFANLFPIVTDTATASPVPFYEHLAAVGSHEVVVETPSHGVDLADLPVEHVAALWGLYRERIEYMAARPEARAVVMFKNRGPRSGASLLHAHGQVLSLPEVPPGVLLRSERARDHFVRTGVPLLASVRDHERSVGLRVLEHYNGFTVFCPWAPHRSYECWIVPDVPSPLPAGDTQSLYHLASVLLRTLRRVLIATDGADYNLVLRLPELTDWSQPYAMWSLEILPRRGGDAGFELSSETHCVLTPPEESAETLRAIHVSI